MAAKKKIETATVTFDHKMATPQSVSDAVAHILRLAGCPSCGRLSQLHVDFVTNPAETKIPGVSSIEAQ
jgi:hypothetical protein